MGIDVDTSLSISAKDPVVITELYNWLVEAARSNIRNSPRNKNVFQRYAYIGEIFSEVMADCGISEYAYGGIIKSISPLEGNSFSVELWHKWNFESGDATALIPFWWLNNKARYNNKLKLEFELTNEVSDIITTNKKDLKNKGKYMLCSSEIGELTLYPEIWDDKDKLFAYCIGEVHKTDQYYDVSMIIGKKEMPKYQQYVGDGYSQMEIPINGHNWVLDRYGRVFKYQYITLDGLVSNSLGEVKYLG